MERWSAVPDDTCQCTPDSGSGSGSTVTTAAMNLKPPHRKPTARTYLSPNDDPGTELTCSGLYTVGQLSHACQCQRGRDFESAGCVGSAHTDCGDRGSDGLFSPPRSQLPLPRVLTAPPSPLIATYIANVIFVNVALLLVVHQGAVVAPVSTTVGRGGCVSRQLNATTTTEPAPLPQTPLAHTGSFNLHIRKPIVI